MASASEDLPLGLEHVTCLVASTPGAGAWLLGPALACSPPRPGGASRPIFWFDPIRVPGLGRRRLGIPVGAPDWIPRYLRGVRKAATQNEVCWVNVLWSHFRWLVRAARMAESHDPDTAQVDPEILNHWFPNLRCVYLGAEDRQRQALRWYSAQNWRRLSLNGQGTPDFQEVRWLESLIELQNRSWHTYFELHGIHPETVTYEGFRSDPRSTVDETRRRVGDVGVPPGRQVDIPPSPHDAWAEVWVDAYRSARPRTRSAVGRSRSAIDQD